MNTIHYFAGEVKRLRLKVYSRENPIAQIIVSGATWELHGFEGKIIDRGACTIQDGSNLSFLLHVDEAGQYCLKVTYQVGSETYITTGRVDCNDCHT